MADARHVDAAGVGGEGSERGRQGADVGDAMVGILFETAGDDVVELLRCFRARACEGDGVLLEDEHDELGNGVALEGRLAAEELVEHGAEGPDVRAHVDAEIALELLRRHEAGRTEELAARGQRVPGVGEDLGDAEVEHLEQRPAVEALGDEEVGGLDVAVHDADGVSLGDGFAGLEHEVDGVGGRERAGAAHAIAKRFAVELLHDHEGLAALEGTHVQHATDVLALELGHDASFALETLEGARVGAVEHELDGDRLLELEVIRREHHAHAAAAELAHDAVLARDDIAGTDVGSWLFGVSGSRHAQKSLATAPGVKHSPRRCAACAHMCGGRDFRERVRRIAHFGVATDLQTSTEMGGSMSANTHLTPGDVIAGRYRIARVIGRGGMGIVYAADHLQLARPVAVKVLKAGVPPVARKRFAREARAVAQLRSQHVCRVFDAGSLAAGDRPYMVMEMLVGEDLGRLVDRGHRFSVEEVVTFAQQACQALAESHAYGIIHRDIKPANLFLHRRSDGTRVVKLLDFGIAKRLGASRDTALTHTDALLGSPRYMSPEQLRSSKAVDARADVWSLGASLYALLTGRMAFPARTITDLVMGILQRDPVPVERVRAAVPPGLARIIERCLEKEPADRFQSAAELAQAISLVAVQDEGELRAAG